MPSRNARYRQLAIGASLLLTGSPASAIFCIADPIIPPCCPTPCPVIDAGRVSKLLADVTSLKQAFDAETQIIQSMTQLDQAIGDTKVMVTSVAKQLSAFPSTISSELTAIQSGLPTNPVAALGVIKQTMFEVSGAAQSSTTQIAARNDSRIAAAQDEQASAFALSLTKSNSLLSFSSPYGQLASIVSGSDQLHVDLAANSTARLAFYQDIGGLHQLAAAWLSNRASSSAMAHPNTGGGTVPQPAAQTQDMSGAGTSPIQAIQSTVDQLVSLHDDRVSAQTLLNAYPALQQTIASAGLADQFVSAAENTLQKNLSALGLASATALANIEQALRSADTSGWLDSDKDGQAQRAAARVLAALTTVGAIPPTLVADSSTAGQQLQRAMSSWLDANKQSQYWAQLAQSAQNSLASLDRSLGVLSDHAGVDLTSSSAAATETALLNKLKQDPSASQWRGVIAAASRDPGALSAIQKAVTQ